MFGILFRWLVIFGLLVAAAGCSGTLKIDAGLKVDATVDARLPLPSQG